MTDSTLTTRALVLTAVIVFGAFAGTVAFAETTAATPTTSASTAGDAPAAGDVAPASSPARSTSGPGVSDRPSGLVQRDGDSEVNLSTSSTEVPQGGIATFTVQLNDSGSSATVVIGNESDDGYQANVSVTDANDDGVVAFAFNTYAAGTTSADNVVQLVGDSGSDRITFDSTESQTELASLLDTGDRVGIDALSAEEVWLPPGAGPTHRAKARHLLTSHPALSPTPPDKQVYVPWQMRALMRRLDDDAQVVFVSPVPDATSVYLARAVQVRDHPVTVVSPDPTTTDTPGRKLAAAARSNRLNDLRNSGVRVVDWGSDEALAEALERARRRWSA